MKQSDIESILAPAMGISAIDAFISRMQDEETEVMLLYKISVERKDKVGFHAAWILEKLWRFITPWDTICFYRSSAATGKVKANISLLA